MQSLQNKQYYYDTDLQQFMLHHEASCHVVIVVIVRTINCNEYVTVVIHDKFFYLHVRSMRSCSLHVYISALHGITGSTVLYIMRRRLTSGVSEAMFFAHMLNQSEIIIIVRIHELAGVKKLCALYKPNL